MATQMTISGTLEEAAGYEVIPVPFLMFISICSYFQHHFSFYNFEWFSQYFKFFASKFWSCTVSVPFFIFIAPTATHFSEFLQVFFSFFFHFFCIRISTPPVFLSTVIPVTIPSHLLQDHDHSHVLHLPRAWLKTNLKYLIFPTRSLQLWHP